MDSKNHRAALDQTFRLLALCARAESHPLLTAELLGQVKAFTAWDILPAQAELHGVAPLLWHHLQAAGTSIPAETRKTLSGLALRHRLLNQAHASVLKQVNALFERSGIRAVVLKGLALGYEYYPNPALRPVSDIDLLLQTRDVLPALDLLQQAGFHVTTPSASLTTGRLPKEVSAYSPAQNGLRTHLELHHHDPAHRSIVDGDPDDEFSGFHAPPHTVDTGDGVIYVPAPMETLDYLFRHFLRHMFVATASDPLPLKWIADVVSLVEHHAAVWDWDKLKQENPALLHRLEVIYSLTPLPDRLRTVIPIRQIAPPRGANCYPQGWPQQVFPEWKRGGFKNYIRHALASPAYIWHSLSVPSAWWLRLQYGIPRSSVFWHGQVVYRIQVLKMVIAKFMRTA
jgi:hypothetical protein